MRLAILLSSFLISTWHIAAGSQVNYSGDWIFLENSEVKVGAIKSSGGGLGYLSRAGSKENLLNHYDRGRLIQQSYYGDADGSKWAGQDWCFNPVQGGDYRGKSAPISKVSRKNGRLYVKSVPLHWATGDKLPCLMEQEITLEGNVVEASYRFFYFGKKIHAARHQELPAVFLQSSLDTLVTYDGDAPWTGAPVSKLFPGVSNEYIKMTENWVAYVNREGEGVGVYVPSVTEATCYRFRGKAGGDLDCSYVAPISTFALTPGLRCSYQAYFTIGTVEEIRERFGKIRQEIAEGKREGALRLDISDGSSRD